MLQPFRFRMLVLIGALVGVSSESSLAQPDSVGSYQGQSNERRSAGSVSVRKPPMGYHVAGSTLRVLNGAYARRDYRNLETPANWSREGVLAYENVYSSWHLVLVKSIGETRPDESGLEWIFVDEAWVPRFVRYNASSICSSGTDFSHVGGIASGMPNLDELPWQVVALLSIEALDRVLQDMKKHNQNVEAVVVEGSGLPEPPKVQGPEFAGDAPPDGTVSPPLDLDTICAAERQTEVSEHHESVASDPWALAELHWTLARCHRQRRNFSIADEAVDAALALKPQYKVALLERGLIAMDGTRYGDASHAFGVLLRLDHFYTGLDSWLVRSHGHQRRVEEAKHSPKLVRPGEQPPEPCNADWCSEDHYVSLGIRCDVPLSEPDGSESRELKQAYKRRSLELHPDRSGADPAAFQRVSQAYTILSDAKRRAAYNDGAEFSRAKQRDNTLGPTHQQLVLRKYFPDRFDYEPFGDPLAERGAQETRLQHDNERSRQEELAKAQEDRTIRGSEL